jgi:ABC-type enterochelin transport system, periplasmic component
VTTLAEVFGEEDAVADRLAALDQRVSRGEGGRGGRGGRALRDDQRRRGQRLRPGDPVRSGLRRAGADPHDEGLTAADHGDAISFEYIAEKDPDILLVLDRDAAIGESGTAAQQVLDNELVRGTTAWENDDVHYLDSSVWYIAPNGLPSVEQMVEEVGAAVR